MSYLEMIPTPIATRTSKEITYPKPNPARVSSDAWMVSADCGKLIAFKRTPARKSTDDSSGFAHKRLTSYNRTYESLLNFNHKLVCQVYNLYVVILFGTNQAIF